MCIVSLVGVAFLSLLHLCKLAAMYFMYTVWLLGGEYHLTGTGIVFVPVHCMVSGISGVYEHGYKHQCSS